MQSRPASLAPAVLDDQILLMLTEGDLDFRSDILASFIASASDCVKALAAADTPIARSDAAHKLKGLAASVGAHALQVLAAKIEAAPGADILSTAQSGQFHAAISAIEARI